MTNLLRHTLLLTALLASQSQADIVMVVGTQSPVAALSREQVLAIYQGRMKTFASGGIPQPLLLAGPSKAEFFERVLGKSDDEMRAHWARLIFTGKGSAPRELSEVSELKRLLAANPDGIAYLPRSAVDGSLKIVYTP
ncbi:hypothetical protein [Chitinimonas sp.]|uniref:hypothetical protein n=1 Tax=Chitinimonas sp. TaxID=1934313 RepID=UPI0035B0BF8D